MIYINNHNRNVYKSLQNLAMLCAILSMLSGTPCIYAQDVDSTEVTMSPTVEDRIRLFIENSIFQSLGILSGVVVSDEYDTGMGFGGNVSQTLLEPGLKLKTTVYFWGASKDSNDVSSLGIEETLFLQKTPHPRLNVFSGVTAGYYALEYDTMVQGINGEQTLSSNDNRFDMYLTTGIRYHYHQNHCFVLYMNYLFTRETDEIHLVAGLEFSKPLQMITGH